MRFVPTGTYSGTCAVLCHGDDHTAMHHDTYSRTAVPVIPSPLRNSKRGLAPGRINSGRR